jgi:hypothetical protein
MISSPMTLPTFTNRNLFNLSLNEIKNLVMPPIVISMVIEASDIYVKFMEAYYGRSFPLRGIGSVALPRINTWVEYQKNDHMGSFKTGFILTQLGIKYLGLTAERLPKDVNPELAHNVISAIGFLSVPGKPVAGPVLELEYFIDKDGFLLGSPLARIPTPISPMDGQTQYDLIGLMLPVYLTLALYNEFPESIVKYEPDPKIVKSHKKYYGNKPFTYYKLEGYKWDGKAAELPETDTDETPNETPSQSDNGSTDNNGDNINESGQSSTDASIASGAQN